MTISPSQIQNVLRTYGKQLRQGAWLNKTKGSESRQSDDQVSISPEAKRAQVVERVASEMVFRMARSDVKMDEAEQAIVDQLSEEFGRPLMVVLDPSRGGLAFNAVDRENDQIVRTLTPEESVTLKTRLVELTRALVDRTML